MMEFIPVQGTPGTPEDVIALLGYRRKLESLTALGTHGQGVWMLKDAWVKNRALVIRSPAAVRH